MLFVFPTRVVLLCRGVAQEESEESEEEEDDEVGETPADASGIASGIATPLRDGIASITSGLDTPESIDLRKQSSKGGLETPITPDTPITPFTPMTPMTPSIPAPPQPELYKVLQTQQVRPRALATLHLLCLRFGRTAFLRVSVPLCALQTSIGTNVLLGSTQKYVLPGEGDAAAAAGGEGAGGDVEKEDGDAEQDKKRKREKEKEKAGQPAKKKSKDYKNVF